MLHGMIVTSVILTLCFIETKGFSQQPMDEQYCTRTKSTSDHVILSTSHALSLITCSFICKENPDCRTFSFSSNVCTLYWKPADQTVSNPGTTSPVTCSRNRKVCPKSIDGGKYTCTYSSTYRFCLCMSSTNMTLADATASCKYYNMNLLAVQNPGKNAFIKSFLNQQISGVTCAWTSGVRQGTALLSFVWSSTGTRADVTMNQSEWIENAGNYLRYLISTPEEKWRFDDTVETSLCRSFCEFQP